MEVTAITGELVKAWLNEARKDRNWLADQVGSSPNTVRNWLGPCGKLPLKIALKIARLMDSLPTDCTQSVAPVGKPDPHSLVIKLSDHDLSILAKYRQLSGQDTAVIARSLLLDHCLKYLSK
jgi:hypothetical protein